MMLKKCLLLPIGIIAICFQINANELISADFKTIDSATYVDYTNKNWSKVIEIGNYALDNNIDYYYLRMRMGIADFNLKNYIRATTHFEKALYLNSGDRNAQLYLYDTYLILGKPARAYKLSCNFTSRTQSLITNKRKLIGNVNAGSGYSFSNNYKLNDNFKLNDDNDSVTGIEVLIGDKSVLYAGSNFRISPSINYYLGYNHLKIQKKTVFQYYDTEFTFDSVQNFSWGYQNYYSYKIKMMRESFDVSIKQNEIYQNFRFQFDKGWAGSVYGNLLFINTANTKLQNQLITGREINYQQIGENAVYLDYIYEKAQITTSDSTFMNYVVGLNLEKDFNCATINLSINYSDLNAATQYQFGLSGFYYLNKKATVYGLTQITWFNQEWTNANNETRYFLGQKFGGRVTSKMWCGAEIVYGNLNNANIDNGSIVYNNVDEMDFKSGVNIKYMLGLHFELNLLYQYISYGGNFIQFNAGTDNTDQIINNYNYQSQNILGGIVWKP
jgi:hypothetical protein